MSTILLFHFIYIYIYFEKIGQLQEIFHDNKIRLPFVFNGKGDQEKEWKVHIYIYPSTCNSLIICTFKYTLSNMLSSDIWTLIRSSRTLSFSLVFTCVGGRSNVLLLAATCENRAVNVYKKFQRDQFSWKKRNKRNECMHAWNNKYYWHWSIREWRPSLQKGLSYIVTSLYM